MQIGEFIPKLDLSSISFPLLPFRYPPSVSWQSLCIFNIQILLVYPSVHCSSCVLWPRVDCSGRCSSRANQELILLTLLEHRILPNQGILPKHLWQLEMECAGWKEQEGKISAVIFVPVLSQVVLCHNHVMSTETATRIFHFFQVKPSAAQNLPNLKAPTHLNTFSRSDSRQRIRFNSLPLFAWKISQQSSFSAPFCSWWLSNVSCDGPWRCHPDTQQTLEGFSSC